MRFFGHFLKIVIAVISIFHSLNSNAGKLATTLQHTFCDQSLSHTQSKQFQTIQKLMASETPEDIETDLDEMIRQHSSALTTNAWAAILSNPKNLPNQRISEFFNAWTDSTTHHEEHLEAIFSILSKHSDTIDPKLFQKIAYIFSSNNGVIQEPVLDRLIRYAFSSDSTKAIQEIASLVFLNLARNKYYDFPEDVTPAFQASGHTWNQLFSYELSAPQLSNQSAINLSYALVTHLNGTIKTTSEKIQATTLMLLTDSEHIRIDFELKDIISNALKNTHADPILNNPMTEKDIALALHKAEAAPNYFHTDRDLDKNLGLKSVAGLLPPIADLEGQKILDIGCGQGAAVKTFRRIGIEAYGISLDLEVKSEKPDYLIQADAMQMPFPDNSFDFAYSAYSIFLKMYIKEERNEKIITILQEIKRVLKPGGEVRLHTTSYNRRLLDLAEEVGLMFHDDDLPDSAVMTFIKPYRDRSKPSTPTPLTQSSLLSKLQLWFK